MLQETDVDAREALGAVGHTQGHEVAQAPPGCGFPSSVEHQASNDSSIYTPSSFRLISLGARDPHEEKRRVARERLSLTKLVFLQNLWPLFRPATTNCVCTVNTERKSNSTGARLECKLTGLED